MSKEARLLDDLYELLTIIDNSDMGDDDKKFALKTINASMHTIVDYKHGKSV